MHQFLSALVIACLLAACQPEDGAPPEGGGPQDAAMRDSEKDVRPEAAGVQTASTEDAQSGIPWQYGNVQAAFERAAAEGKPVFLYWGAQWCPPCHEIKATIFSTREFIERSRLFVPVYLDGDTEDAQREGDRFGVFGYPTMIVFRPDGTEITRIPGGLNIQRYAGVLDLALADARPVAVALQAVLDGTGLAVDDYRLFAYYSWRQDNQRALKQREPVDVLRAISTSCPVEIPEECSRIFAEYLMAAVETESVSLSEAQSVDMVRRVNDILRSPRLAAVNHELIINYGNETVGLTAPGTEQRAQLVADWHTALDRIADDENASLTERLGTTETRIRLARVDDDQAVLAPELLEQARSRVAWADARAITPSQRQSVMNSARHVLSEAGLADEANAMLLAEIEKSGQPYYFMSELADLAKTAGQIDSAVGWLRRAYDEAQGPATRFQWGTNYVIGLLEMTPDDATGIQAAVLEVLTELDQRPDAFHGRNKLRLERLDTKLSEWNADGRRNDTLMAIRHRVAEMCADVEGDELGRNTCNEFLSKSVG